MSSFVSPRGVSMSAWLIGSNVFLLLILILRQYAARIQQRSFRLDDGFLITSYVRLRDNRQPFTELWVAYFSQVALLIMQATTSWAIANGLGAHSSELNMNQQIVQAKLTFSAAWTWTFATVFCKLAMLALYNEIFTTPKFRRLSHILMGACGAYPIIFIPLFMTQCTPLKANWNPKLGRCRPLEHEEYASVSVNMALDLAIVLLPMPTIWKLQLPLGRKIFVSFMFSLGFLTVGIMAWRIQSTVYGRVHSDHIYHDYYTSLLSHMEIWLGITSATLPTLAPIVSRVLVPAFSKLATSYRKIAAPIRSRTNESRTRSGKSVTNIQLPSLGFSRRKGERLVSFSNLRYWGASNSISNEEGLVSSIRNEDSCDPLHGTAISRDSHVLAEPI